MINKNFDSSREASLEKIEEILKKLEAKTNLPRKKIFIILITVLALIWFKIFDIYFSYITTIYFPIIWSIKSIESKDVELFKQWLAYWVIFSIFVLLDMISPILINFIPFYFIIRTVVLLWLSLPKFKGALMVYDVLLVKLIKISREVEFFRNLSNIDSLKTEVEEIIQEKDNNNEKENICEASILGLNTSGNLNLISNLNKINSPNHSLMKADLNTPGPLLDLSTPTKNAQNSNLLNNSNNNPLLNSSPRISGLDKKNN